MSAERTERVKRTRRAARGTAILTMLGTLVSGCGSHSLGFAWNPPQPQHALNVADLEAKYVPLLRQIVPAQRSDEVTQRTSHQKFHGKCVLRIELSPVHAADVNDAAIAAVLSPAGFEALQEGSLNNGMAAKYAVEKSGQQALFEFDYQDFNSISILIRDRGQECQAR